MQNSQKTLECLFERGIVALEKSSLFDAPLKHLFSFYPPALAGIHFLGTCGAFLKGPCTEVQMEFYEELILLLPKFQRHGVIASQRLHPMY